MALCSIAKLVLPIKREDRHVEGKLTVLQLIEEAGMRFNPTDDVIIEVSGDVRTPSHWVDIVEPSQEAQDDASYLIVPKAALALKT